MKSRVVRLVACATLSIFFAGCAGRSLPEYEAPLPRSQFMKVRTTAYTETESDHRRYGKSSAVGTTSRAGPVRSAAADWARWPAGTRFLILATGQVYVVDDYGWALSGRNTIDLYCPSRVGNERLGCSPRHHSDFGMGRSLEKLPCPETASRLRACPQDAEEIRSFY